MAEVSVRPARPDDASELGRIQVATWQWGYRTIVPAQVLAALDAEQAAAAWLDAITNPPTPQHRVLVAHEGQFTVGFAAAGPDADVEQPPGERTITVAALLVEPRWQRRGHGSRLMAAVVDLAREDGVSDAIMWLPEGDTATREFLAGAGWAPDGFARVLDTGAEELREIRLHTRLGDDPA